MIREITDYYCVRKMKMCPCDNCTDFNLTIPPFQTTSRAVPVWTSAVRLFLPWMYPFAKQRVIFFALCHTVLCSPAEVSLTCKVAVFGIGCIFVVFSVLL